MKGSVRMYQWYDSRLMRHWQGVGALCSRLVYAAGEGVTVDISLEQGLSRPL